MEIVVPEISPAEVLLAFMHGWAGEGRVDFTIDEARDRLCGRLELTKILSAARVLRSAGYIQSRSISVGEDNVTVMTLTSTGEAHAEELLPSVDVPSNGTESFPLGDLVPERADNFRIRDPSVGGSMDKSPASARRKRQSINDILKGALVELPWKSMEHLTRQILLLAAIYAIGGRDNFVQFTAAHAVVSDWYPGMASRYSVYPFTISLSKGGLIRRGPKRSGLIRVTYTGAEILGGYIDLSEISSLVGGSRRCDIK